MANILRRPSGKYKITVYYTRDIKGNLRRKCCTFVPTKTTPKAIEKEVQAYAREFEERVKNGQLYEGEKTTFYDVAMKWHDDYAVPHLAKGNVENSMYYLDKWAFNTIGTQKISAIKPIQFQSIFDEMNKQGYAPKTIKCVYNAISSVMSYAYRLEIIENNPLSRCKLPSIKKNNDIHFFTDEQVKAFLRALDKEYSVTIKQHESKNGITGKAQTISEYEMSKPISIQFKVLFRLAIYGGFRLGEIIALTWNDIDFNNNIIHIRHSTGRSKEGQYIKTPKTLTSVRDVQMSQSCMDMLKEWYEQEKSLANALGTAWQGKHGKAFDSSFIFIQYDGKQMDSHTPYHKFKTIISKYNATVDDESQKLPNIRFHDLRHTCATLLIALGVDIETISNRLGHSNTSITLDVYGHYMKKNDVIASEKLGMLLDDYDSE